MSRSIWEKSMVLEFLSKPNSEVKFGVGGGIKLIKSMTSGVKKKKKVKKV